MENLKHPLSVAPSELQTEHLPAVGMLSYATPESICGKDDRTQVTNTQLSPYYFICSLIITMPNGGRYIGSGWLASFNNSFADGNWANNVIMTSGHCVYAGGSTNSFAKSVQVISGRNGTQQPYGSYTATTNCLRASDEWQKTGNSDYDYGAILVPKEIIDTWGSMGWANVSTEELEKMNVTNTGYPGDKPSGTMWTANGPITKVTQHKIEYMNDTYGGQSGSPAYSSYEGYLRTVGIHGYGGCPNASVRLTQNVVDDMLIWANDPC